MARQALTICGRSFKTKASLEVESKRIRDAQPLGVPLDRDTRAFIEEVYRQLYPRGDYAEKRLDVGAKAITVISIMGGRCFRFSLNDGRTVEPSLRACFQKSLSNPAPTAYAAFRYEVFPDCRRYRDAYFARHADSLGRAPCELTGQHTTLTDCEVDHIPPNTFRAILDSYLADRGLTLSTVPTKDPPDGIGAILADRAQADDWRRYHLSRASFRVLSHQAHVDETKRQLEASRQGRTQKSSPPGFELVLSKEELAALFSE